MTVERDAPITGKVVTSWEGLVKAGKQAASLQWTLGDLACEVETTYGDHTLQEYAEAIGVPYKSLLAYRTVAQAFPEGSRNLEISWSVHQVLASQDDRSMIMKWPADTTVKDTRKLVNDRRRHARELPKPAAKKHEMRLRVPLKSGIQAVIDLAYDAEHVYCPHCAKEISESS